MVTEVIDNGERPHITVYLRQDVVNALGENIKPILKACQAHLMDAVSTELTIQQRFHCLDCMTSEILPALYDWLNEKGHEYILEDFEYVMFMSEVVRWGQGWIKKRLLSPCTDGMPSSEVH